MEHETQKYFIKIKRLINHIIELLENSVDNINNSELTENQINTLELIIGKRENLVSVILKLTNILLKLQPFEKSDNIVLSDIDVNIINEFLKKYSNS